MSAWLVLAMLFADAPGVPAAEGASTSTAHAVPGRPDHPLRFVWVDLANTSGFTFDRVTHRLREIFAPTGLVTSWLHSKPGEVSSLHDVTVVLLPESKTGRTGPGSASVRLRMIWVCPVKVAAVVGVLDSNPVSWTADEELLVADALAVVMAHELVHVLSGRGHDGSRLMSPKLLTRDLRDRTLLADPKTFLVLERGALLQDPNRAGVR